MRVLVGTPMAGGQVYGQYLLSFLEVYNACTLHKQEVYRQFMASNPGFNQADPQHQKAIQEFMHKNTYDIALYTLGGESLLPRGRNHIAQVALMGAYDKLMFIDADAGWSWAQMKRILDSTHPFIAGLCPLKTYSQPGWQLSLNYLPFNEDEKYFNNALRTPEATKRMAQEKGSDVFSVAFVGTAFMCISRLALQRMAELSDEYLYPNPHSGQPEVHWNIFACTPINDYFMSEDWSACEVARQCGFEIMVDSSVIISHVGNHVFHV